MIVKCDYCKRCSRIDEVKSGCPGCGAEINYSLQDDLSYLSYLLQAQTNNIANSNMYNNARILEQLNNANWYTPQLFKR